MSRWLKQVGKHSLTYSVSYVVASLSSILLLPVYTRYLSRSDYGTLSLIDQSLGYISIVFFLGGSAAITRFYNHFETEGDKRAVISTGLWMALASSLAGAVGMAVASRPLARAICGSAEQHRIVYFMAVILVTESLFAVSVSYLSAAKNSRRFVAYSLMRTLLGMTGNIAFVVFLKLGVVGMIYGQALSNTSMCLVALCHAVGKNGVRFDRAKAAMIVKYGAPLAPATILGSVIHNADQYLVRFFNGLDDVGVYSLGYKVAFSAYSMLTISINLIWGSAIIYEIYREADAQRIYAKLSTYIISFIVACLFVVSVFSEYIVTLLAAPEYFSASRVIPVVCLGLVAYGMHMFISVGPVISNRTWLMVFSHGVAAVCNVALNVLLIPRYGYMGAAYASVVTYFVFATASCWIYRRVYSIPFEWKKLSFLLCACIVLYLLSTVDPWQDRSLLFLWRAILCATLLPVVYFSGFLNGDERGNVREFCRGFFKGGLKASFRTPGR